MTTKMACHHIITLTACLCLAACSTTEGGGGAVDASVPADADIGAMTDDDGDGFTEIQGDCDDSNADINPDAVEICGDSIDNNCNGATDSAEPDGDGDGFGPCNGDCNDSDPAINPAATEVDGDGIDNNCDGITDADFDGDGFTVADGDCNDGDDSINPDAVENCFDMIDNDCDGFMDMAQPDADLDGFGPCQGDCDDTDPNISPGLPEIDGDGIDNNCDNLIDADIDGDGWTVANGDCDDNDPTRNPAATEICGDGTDQNCDGTDTDCLTDCQIAALSGSNIGCEYLALDMDQLDQSLSPGDDECFAVIVSNTHPTDTANVVIERWVAGTLTTLNFPGNGTSRTIAPGALEVFRVSGNCSAPGPAVSGNAGINKTAIGQNAFRVTSDVPVAAYQINPYEAASIHTTDASLLIASAALDNEYIVLGFSQSFPSARIPGFNIAASMNVVATEDNTTVTVTSSTNTQAGGGVPALSPGSIYTTTLNAGENLQIATNTTPDDFSGTRVVASAPVAVFSGSECTDIPIAQGYCDHLEEQLMPLSTWGSEYVAANHPQRGSESTLWKFVAAQDNTTITFDPMVNGNITLDAGEVATFTTTSDFVATSTDLSKAFFVIQFMQGAQQTALESGITEAALGNLRGDPAMTISVPTAQYLSTYGFLSDPTYAYNWLVVVRTNSTDQVRLDCFDPIPNNRFTTIGAGPYQVAKITLSAQSGGVDGTCTSGAHTINGDGPFGIWVYGVFEDTSYGYPGGMNLERIFTPN